MSQTNVKITVQVGDHVLHPRQLSELLLGSTRESALTLDIPFISVPEDSKDSQHKEPSSWIFIALKITQVSN